jgi:hypothetical protein
MAITRIALGGSGQAYAAFAPKDAAEDVVVFTRMALGGSGRAYAVFEPKSDDVVEPGDGGSGSALYRLGDLGALNVSGNPNCGSGANWMSYGAVLRKSLGVLGGYGGARQHEPGHQWSRVPAIADVPGAPVEHGRGLPVLEPGVVCG